MRVLNDSKGEVNGDVNLDRLDCSLLIRAITHLASDLPVSTKEEFERLQLLLDQITFIRGKL